MNKTKKSNTYQKDHQLFKAAPLFKPISKGERTSQRRRKKIKQKGYKDNEKMIVFDLSGTLIEEVHTIRNVLHPLTKERGLNLNYEEVRGLYELYKKGNIDETTFNKLIPKEIEAEFLDKLKILKSSIDTVRYLKKKGYVLGILSNIPSKWGHYLISKFRLKKLFDHVVFSGDYKLIKPDKRLYFILLNKARMLPQSCYYIDDKIENLETAKDLSFNTIYIKREETHEPFSPQYQISKISDLKRVF
jgi:HAD superfamily hydrolase (TIGR01509 family)